MSSTKLTKNPPHPTLFQLLDRARGWFEPTLFGAFEAEAAAKLSRADIHLLAHLNCGTTYASELARRLGVSRQAAAKLLKNLIEAGLIRLEPAPDRRNTKWIVITEAGKAAISRAVEELEKAERLLERRIGSGSAQALRAALEAEWGPPPSTGGSSGRGSRRNSDRGPGVEA